MSKHARLVVAGATAALLALSSPACGGDDDAAGADETEREADGSTTSETTASDDDTTTTTIALTPEEEVVRDYEAASAAFSAAANPPNPDSRELAAHFTGSSLSRYQTTLRSLEAAGATAENTVEHHPVSVTITGETAQVEDCFVDTTQQFNAATGEPLGEPSTTTMHVNVQLERVNGVWLVAERTERADPCTPE